MRHCVNSRKLTTRAITIDKESRVSNRVKPFCFLLIVM